VDGGFYGNNLGFLHFLLLSERRGEKLENSKKKRLDEISRKKSYELSLGAENFVQLKTLEPPPKKFE